MSTIAIPLLCSRCAHSVALHRYHSPTPACASCPDLECVDPVPTPPAEWTARRSFVGTVADSVEYPSADMAWRLVLDAWRVVEVASARAGVPPTPNREEWMAALRVATFRAYHDTPEADPFAGSYRANDPCDMCEGTVTEHEPECRLSLTRCPGELRAPL